MANTFTIGDKVILKSGSVPMTIESIQGDTIYCVWFAENTFSRNNFPALTLMISA